jgi:hypothetical protein
VRRAAIRRSSPPGRTARFERPAARPEPIGRLQTTLGNRAMHQLLARDDARARPGKGGGRRACQLAITGPSTVDHYCRKVVSADNSRCGRFPAASAALSATGAAAGATLTWRIVKGASKASIAGDAKGADVEIQGDAASAARDDVTVEVSDGSCTATHTMTVREPSRLSAAKVPLPKHDSLLLMITYTVLDQFGDPMGARICVSEDLETCADNHPELGGFTAKDNTTNDLGQVTDTLASPLPAKAPPLCAKIDQALFAGGCGPLLRNVIRFETGGVSVTQGQTCASGDPCP